MNEAEIHTKLIDSALAAGWGVVAAPGFRELGKEEKIAVFPSTKTF